MRRARADEPRPGRHERDAAAFGGRHQPFKEALIYQAVILRHGFRLAPE